MALDTHLPFTTWGRGEGHMLTNIHYSLLLFCLLHNVVLAKLWSKSPLHIYCFVLSFPHQLKQWSKKGAAQSCLFLSGYAIWDNRYKTISEYDKGPFFYHSCC